MERSLEEEKRQGDVPTITGADEDRAARNQTQNVDDADTDETGTELQVGDGESG
jgi:hypothetical protein